MTIKTTILAASLALGALTGCSTAFAETPYGNDNRHGGYSRHHRDHRDRAHGISLAVFQNRALAECQTAFGRADQNRDGALSRRELSYARDVECDAWSSTRGRWGRGRAMRGNAITWQQLRQNSLAQSRRTFIQADRDRNGVLTQAELLQLRRPNARPLQRIYIPQRRV